MTLIYNPSALMKYAMCLLVLVGCAWGQTVEHGHFSPEGNSCSCDPGYVADGICAVIAGKPAFHCREELEPDIKVNDFHLPTTIVPDPVDTDMITTNLVVSTAYCERTITMGTTVKKFREIFPNECRIDSGVLGVERTEGIAPHTLPPESKVVPAIVVGSHLGYGDCQGACMDHPIADYSCADKSRVLLTTEEGKKICVKF
jgi:hypothetical protein